MQPISIRSTRIVLFALIAGLVLFLGVTTFLRTTQGPLGAAQSTDVLTLVVPVLFVGAAGAYFVVQRALLAAARANSAENLALARQDRMPSELQRRAIVGAALAEGPGLFATIVVLLGGPWYLIAATVLSIAWIASLLPSREGIEAQLREAH